MEAAFQLGLCHAAGFGTHRDYDTAVRLVGLAARGGLPKAQVVTPRIAAALGIPLDPEIQQSMKAWLTEGSEMGSRTASKDLERLDREQYLARYSWSQQHNLEPSEITSNGANAFESSQDSPLLSAAKSGHLKVVEELITQGADVNSEGQYGETPLHCSVLLPEKLGLLLADALLNAGADIYKPTSRRCSFSKHDFLLNTIPEHTTALEWAIADDHLSLVKLFLESSCSINHPRLDTFGSTTAPLACAAQYQSVKCLEYLCNELCGQGSSNIHLGHINTFDKHGYSVFYYAVRPDLFDRLLRFVPEEGYDPPPSDIPPVIARELKVIDMLLASGSNMDVKSAQIFNCLHLIAAFGEPHILESILRRKRSGHFINQKSQYGYMPLADAIFRNREAAFRLLLEHHANPTNAWPECGGHAIHVCCRLLNNSVVSFAEKLLQEYPSCLGVRDRYGRTPLHFAAGYGNFQLIDFFLSKGAALLSFDTNGITPLGIAIQARSIRAVRKLRVEHDRRRLPLLAFTLYWMRYFSAFEFLLAPGLLSPTHIREMVIPYHPFGCCDHPFSESSLNVLNELLEHFEHRVKFGINFFQSLIHPTYKQVSGIRTAVRMGNLEAVDMIIKSRKFKVDLRDLLKLAFNQRIIGAQHIASEEAREEMVVYLWQEQQQDYTSLRENRQKSRLRFIWKLYYRLYGTMEQKHYERVNEWQFNNRYYWNRLFPELGQWIHIRFSFTLFLYIFIWCLLCPILVCLAFVAADPATHYSTSNKVYTALMVVLVCPCH